MQPNNSSQAYQSSQKLGSSARQTEAQALLEAARMMDASVNDEDSDAYRAALRLNWRLWTIIQADVSSVENPLPDEIRQNILNLSVFIDKHTVNALAEPSGRKLRVLVDINRNIAAGLMTNVGEGAALADAQSQPAAANSGGDVVA